MRIIFVCLKLPRYYEMLRIIFWDKVRVVLLLNMVTLLMPCRGQTCII